VRKHIVEEALGRGKIILGGVRLAEGELIDSSEDGVIGQCSRIEE
jgi:hypothetical protein